LAKGWQDRMVIIFENTQNRKESKHVKPN
jgi:hypothetical protein